MKKTNSFVAAFLILALSIGCFMCVPFTASAASVSEKESNNTITTANTVSIGDTASGEISTEDDVDYYKLTLSSAGRLTIKFTSYIEYYSIYLLNKDGNLVWHSTSNAWVAEAGKVTNPHTLDLLSGTYYLKIEGTWLWSLNDVRARYTGNYNFLISFVSANETIPEPNQSILQAAAVSFDTTVKGQIAINDDVDYVSFRLPSAGRISIEFTSEIAYYSLYVFDEDGKSVWNSTSNAWVAEAGRVKNTHTLDLLSGTYYLKIEGTWLWSLNDVRERYTGNYNFIISFMSAGENIPEPNNSIVYSASIGLGSLIKGQIALNDSVDYCGFTLKNDDTITIKMQSWMPYYSLYILNDAGELVWDSTSNAYNSNTEYIENEHEVELSAGTYYLKIEGTWLWSLNDVRESYTGNYSFTISAPNNPTLSPATNLTATPSDSGKITLKWTGSTGATQYNIYKNGSYFATVYAPTITCTATGLTDGTYYSFYVRSVKKANGEATVVADPSNTVKEKAVVTPAAPQDLKATALSSTSIKLTWTASKGATQYNIYRYNGTEKKYVYKGTSYTTSYTDTGLSPNVTYYYQICAVTKYKTLTLVSPYTKANAKTPSDVIKPAVPKNINAVPSAENTITVSWSLSAGATQYNIYRYNGTKKAYVYIGTSYSNCYHATKLSAWTTYYFKVVPVTKKDGHTVVGDYSAAVSAKAVKVPAVPANLAATSSSAKTIKLTWTASTGATQYNIYRYNGTKKAYVYKGTSYTASFTDTSAASGTTYYYRVVAVTKASGLTLVSNFSAAANAKTK